MLGQEHHRRHITKQVLHVCEVLLPLSKEVEVVPGEYSVGERDSSA